MPVPTYAEFLIAFPEFATPVETPAVQRQLTLTGSLLDEDTWGDWFEQAVGLDVAHNLTLSQMATNGGANGALQAAMGPVSSVSAAGVSTSFATQTPQGVSESRDWYSKTGYGQQFLRLQRAVIPMGAMTI